MGTRAIKCCFQNMAWLLNTWNYSSYGCLYKPYTTPSQHQCGVIEQITRLHPSWRATIRKWLLGAGRSFFFGSLAFSRLSIFQWCPYTGVTVIWFGELKKIQEDVELGRECVWGQKDLKGVTREGGYHQNTLYSYIKSTKNKWRIWKDGIPFCMGQLSTENLKKLLLSTQSTVTWSITLRSTGLAGHRT